MEPREVDLLQALAREVDYSQRELARLTDTSPGTVNALIKKCARKGLIKIEKLNSRNMRYLITPRGLKKLTSRTLSYVKRSYKAIKKLRQTVREKARQDLKAGRSIFLLGAQDEVREIIESVLGEQELPFKSAYELSELNELLDDGLKSTVPVIYYWDPDLYSELMNLDYLSCNVMELNI